MDIQQQLQERQSKIVARFTEMDDPLFAYELLLDTARRGCDLPACYKVDQFKVKGCQSQAWLWLSEEEDGTLHIVGDSDTLVVQGIISLLAESFNGLPCSLVAIAPTSFLQEAGVMSTFDTARRNGIGKIIETIKSFARNHSWERI